MKCTRSVENKGIASAINNIYKSSSTFSYKIRIVGVKIKGKKKKTVHRIMAVKIQEKFKKNKIKPKYYY